MSPELRAAIDAAEDLAWRPTYNLPGSLSYTERREAADRLCERLARVGKLSANASPELRFLVDAMRRVAGCSFAKPPRRALLRAARRGLRAPRLPRRLEAGRRVRRRLADLLVAAALRLMPDGQMFDLDDDGPITDEQWAGLLILHAEAIHGCEHTEQARRELGMAGPRGRAADAEVRP